MKVSKQILLSGYLSGLLLTSPLRAEDTTSHGYLRSGVGLSKSGSDQECFTSSGRTFRLGNECNTYGELSLGHAYSGGSSATDPQYKSVLTLSLGSAGERGYESTEVSVSSDFKASSTLSVALVEAYVSAENVLSSSGSLWVGKRYYQRHDVHMLDFYYLNNSGPGFGLENMIFGAHKLSLAIIRNIPPEDKGIDQPVQTNFDLRLAGIPAPAGGKIEAVAIYGSSGPNGARSGDKKWEELRGAQLALIHRQPLTQGQNTLVAQYGYGLFGAIAKDRISALDSFGGWSSQTPSKEPDARGLKEARMASSTLRLIDDFVAKLTDRFSLGAVAIFQATDFGSARGIDTAPSQSEITLGLRPIWHFHKNWDLAFELGHTSVSKALAVKDPNLENLSYKDTQLTKVSLAPQVSLGEFYFGRPNIRFFTTYAFWNKESKGQISKSLSANHTSGFSTGAQFETWW